MRIILLPLLFSIAVIGFENRDKIMDQYNAAYPADPAKNSALAQCAQNPNFNRMDTDDRHECYVKYLSHEAAFVPAVQTPSASYAYSPSNLPQNDIRRQQANDDYLQESIIKAAEARPVVIISTLHQTRPQVVVTPRHTVHAYHGVVVSAAQNR